MTDTTDNSTPAPLAAPHDLAIDTANVVHDGERATRHGLSHLEDEFLAEWDKLFTGMHDSAKRLLAFVASKL
jgi:hypothetical protein